MNRISSCTMVLMAVALLASVSASYANVVWDHTYGDTGNDMAETIIRTHDGGFVIGGTVQTAAGDLDIRVIKVDDAGNTLWQTDVGGAANDECHDIIETILGDIVLAGRTGFPPTTYNGLLVRLDADGNELWQQTYGGAGKDILRAVYQSGSGDLVATGNTETGGGGIYLVRTDPDGVARWTHVVGAPGDYAYGVAKSGDGGSVIAGYHTDGSLAPDTDALFIKVGVTGSFISRTTFDHGVDDKVYNMDTTPDGEFVLAGASEGKLTLWKVDNTGALSWRGVYADGDVCTSVDATSSGFFLSGYYYDHDGMQFQMVVVQASTSGTETGSAELGGALWEFPGAVASVGNGDYVVAGSSTSFGAGGYDWYVVRGNTSSPTTGVGDTPTARVTLSAAPNPFNPQTRITFTMPAPGPARLSVYDVAGRRIATLVDGPVAAGATTITWRGVTDNGRTVASGVYFARLQTAGSQAVYKLVVTK